MRRHATHSAIALAAFMLAAPAVAQSTTSSAPAAAAAAPATTPPTDPVLATVNGAPIHLSDLQNAANDLPQQLQQLPPDQLLPLLLNQQIDRRALLAAAHKEKLQKRPDVEVVMQAAADEKLENAYVQQQVTPKVTEAAIQAEYKKDYANKPGAPQIKARHILLKTQAEAQSIIDQLNKGADFAKLASANSIDPGAKTAGGELGWFSQNEMVPAFSAAAFALQPGQYTKTPVQTQFGWHVILCEGKRNAPPQALADVHDQIRSNLADAAIKATLADARSKVKIVVNTPPGQPTTAPAQ